MSELLPYETKLANELQNLPLPDENMAWADMKRRLDEDDDNIVPVWWRGCLLWSLLCLVLLVTGWWFLKHTTNDPIKQTIQRTDSLNKQSIEKDGNAVNNNNTLPKNDTIKKIIINDSSNTKQIIKDPLIDTGSNTKKEKNVTAKVEMIDSKQAMLSKTILHKTIPNKIRIKTRKSVVENDTNIQSINSDTSHIKTIRRKLVEPHYKKTKSSKGGIEETIDEEESNKPIKNKPSVTDDADNNIVDSTIKHISNPLPVNKDSIQKNSPDTAQKKSGQTKTSTKEKKKGNPIKQPIWFSTGIALTQQLPIAGQTLTSYNAEGRKGNLADYIPSVYARMYKGNKWFIQTEFRYGAPQNTKDIIFQERKDTGFQVITNDTSKHLKKTYYNQVPVTFNYFVLPNWSVGAGFIWNKFTSAVSEQEITQHNNITDSNFVVSKNLITNKVADSNFVSSYFQYVLETQYRWKKLSLGVRYTFGLQPYLKFTLPGGTQQQEKNQSVLLFIRYELWRSKRSRWVNV